MATPPQGKTKVTVNLDGALVLKAKVTALELSQKLRRTIHLQDLIEAGLRDQVKKAVR